MSVPRSLLFCVMNLYVIKWSLVWCNFSEPCQVVTLVLIEVCVKPVVNHCGEEFVNLWTTTDRSVVFSSCHVYFLWLTVILTFFHELGAMEFCLMIKLKISCIIFVVSSSALLRSSALIPLLSAAFPHLRLSVAIINSFTVSSGMRLSCSLSSTFFIVSMVTSIFKSYFAVLLVFSFIVLTEKRSV